MFTSSYFFLGMFSVTRALVISQINDNCSAKCCVANLIELLVARGRLGNSSLPSKLFPDREDPIHIFELTLQPFYYVSTT